MYDLHQIKLYNILFYVNTKQLETDSINAYKINFKYFPTKSQGIYRYNVIRVGIAIL